MKIALIPIDDRPVCYSLPLQIAAVDEGIELFLPPRGMLGNLTDIADIEGVLGWLEGLEEVDALVIALDTIAYGGLIPSRRSNDSFEQIAARLERLKPLIRGKKVYAFSSIMRISNNNINEEEKDYWAQWGKKIYEYSYNRGQEGEKAGGQAFPLYLWERVETLNEPTGGQTGGEFSVSGEGIPAKILDDYLYTRKRNFEINKLYLGWQKEGLFETLIFSKDDSGRYGLNVCEARELEALGGHTKTGADEIPLTLLARAIVFERGKGEACPPALPPSCPLKIRIAPIFTEPSQKHLVSNYEDISIEKSVKGQIELAGCEVCAPDEADLLLYVNNFIDHQGEIVMGVSTEPFKGSWKKPDKPCLIADVRFANGADNEFIKSVLEGGFDENFFGFAAWNTSANTLGSVICAGVTKFLAKKYNNRAFKKLQLIRFLDDWAYQANVRQSLSKPDTAEIKAKMKPYEQILKQKFIECDIKYSFPWNRLFEVEIVL